MQLHYITKLILNKNKQGKGLILFILLLIFGILSGNTLSALSQSSYDASGEAKLNISALLRAQQGYFLENSVFARAIVDLGIGIRPKTNNYRYVIVPSNNVSLPSSTHQARPHVIKIGGRVYGSGQYNKAVIGGVVAIKSGGYFTTLSKLCIASLPPVQGGPIGTESMVFSTTGLRCPTGYQ